MTTSTTSFDTTGMYKVYCEVLSALPGTERVFWKVWAHSPTEARRKVFGYVRGDYKWYVVTEEVEFLPDEPYVSYDLIVKDFNKTT